jgi:hypothetical protein
MEVSGQFHTLAALPPEEVPPVHGLAPEQVWTPWRREKTHCLCLESNRVRQPLARRPID